MRLVQEGVPSRLKRERPSRVWWSSVSTSARSSLNSRLVPAPSDVPGAWVCGSHFVQSHWSVTSVDATTATSRSSGECSATSPEIIARAEPRTETGSPETTTW